MPKPFANLIPGAATALLLCCGIASAGDALPPEQHFGVISYRTGGVGLDESTAMKASAAHYPLALTFVGRIGKRDAYIAGVKVRITGTGGSTVLDITSDGPFLLVELPDGRYQVSAESGGTVKSHNVQVKARTHAGIVFEWIDQSGQ